MKYAQLRSIASIAALCMAILMLCLAWSTEDALALSGSAAESGILEAEDDADASDIEDIDLPDEDEMLTLFMQNEVASQTAKGTSGSRATRGSRLTGNNYVLYQAIRPVIEDIASGKRSSTVVKVPLSEVVGTDYKVTAAELGLSSLSASGAATQAAVNEFISYDLESVFRALLVDLPYDFYWFDKIKGCVSGAENNTYSFTSKEAVFSSKCRYTFTFYVSTDYSKTGKRGATSVDTSRAASAASAAANAAALIKSCSSMSDINKLHTYKNEICSLVSYNNEAMALNSSSSYYGDPWQMIYVFDGDPTTNVVCEGYAKAFQFLCDNTPFRGSIESRIATGTMYTELTSGPHMWNILSMDDGMNYIADITNCDADNSDMLFLTGAYIGSVHGGYVFKTNSGVAGYEYDDETMALYSDRELYLRQDNDYGTKVSSLERANMADAKAAVRKSISKAKITGISARIYSGKARTQTPVVRLSGITLRKGTDYKLTYKKNKNVGTATVVITGINNYKGTISKSFRINPKGTSFRSVSPEVKALRIRWNKQAAKMGTSRITGYQVQLATNSKFTKNKKTIRVKGYSNTSRKVTGLKAGTAYYIRIRTYKTVGGKTYYSAWSSI